MGASIDGRASVHGRTSTLVLWGGLAAAAWLALALAGVAGAYEFTAPERWWRAWGRRLSAATAAVLIFPAAGVLVAPHPRPTLR